MNKIITAIGTMSGTSMDGIDVALLKTDGEYYIDELADASLSYPRWLQTLLKAAELAVHNAKGNLAQAEQQYADALQHYLCHELMLEEPAAAQYLSHLSDAFFQAIGLSITLTNVITYSTTLHAAVIRQLLSKANYTTAQIDVIGYHGQTLYHNPAERITVQVGNGAQLANELGINVITDFRSNDVAHGGQGAPFAPLYHQAIAVGDNVIPCALINCGGIANITVINGKCAADILGFDTGPGNGLIDRFVKQRTQGQLSMDRDGQFGIKGLISETILGQLFSQHQHFLNQLPPKSLDIAEFYLTEEFANLSLEDGCATLEAFTAACIAHAIGMVQVIKPSWATPKRLTLAGGGWYNPVITQQLTQRLHSQLSGCEIIIAEKASALEAQIFAYLAVRSLQEKPISFPETTGVSKPLTGGKLIQAKLA